MDNKRIIELYTQKSYQKNVVLFDLIKSWILYLFFGYLLLLDHPFLNKRKNIAWTVLISTSMILLIFLLRSIKSRKISNNSSLNELQLKSSLKILLTLLLGISYSLLLLLLMKLKFNMHLSVDVCIKVIAFPIIVSMLWPLERSYSFTTEALVDKIKSNNKISSLKHRLIASKLTGLNNLFIQNKKATIKDGTETYKIPVSKVTYIKSDGRLKKIHLNDEVVSFETGYTKKLISTNASFPEILKKLDYPNIIKINKSVAINKDFIESIKRNELFLKYKDGRKVFKVTENKELLF